jgi:hypothetical protein
LTQGPAFLLLGQKYLALESGTDGLLSEVAKKYVGASHRATATYDSILDTQASAAVEASLAWIEERCRRISPPDWLVTIADFPWSGVVTSAIDTVWWSAFRRPWRELQPLFEEKYRPVNPRNRLLLHCTFLFGCVNQSDEAKRPPLKRLEWLARRQTAIALLRRLPELVTPLGSLLIEGYEAQEDWLRPEDLIPVLDGFNKGQVHVFSAGKEWETDPLLSGLVAAGKVTVHSSSLGQLLQRASELGFITFGQPAGAEGASRSITVAGRPLGVPADLWNQVSRSATVLDDAFLSESTALSEDARYSEFRNFLSSIEGQARWAGYGRGFAFDREYAARLKELVGEALAARHISDEPFVVHGQSGTGKTIALEMLAYSVRREGLYPVLFVERKVQRPIWSDVDRFCQWAEDADAPACLLVWDGMLNPEEYSDFLRILSGRGRRVVLVGSAYKIDNGRLNLTKFVEAPAELSEQENGRFAGFLGSFHPSLAEFVTDTRFGRDRTFLVALYRLLPPARTAIRSGIAREIGHAEDLIAAKAQTARPEVRANTTALEIALVQAGIISEEQLISPDSTRDVDGEPVSEIQDLTGLVMVPGRFGLKVPIEILLRSLGRPAYANFIDLFKGVDIFRWVEDAVGNIDIGPRNQLEAKLIVQARMGGPRMEVKYATRLLVEINDEGSDTGIGREEAFAVDLIRALGAQGEERYYFEAHFRDLSDCLKELRESRGVVSPRIMLQEANLLREWATARSNSLEASVVGASPEDLSEVLDAFDEAYRILLEALERLGNDRRARVLRTHLLAELASTLAAKARHALKTGVAASGVVALFSEARRALADARRSNPGNYYPVDILAWSSRDMLTSGVLQNDEAAEVLADVFHAFDTTDEAQLDATQRERFHMRRLELAQLLDVPALADEAFESLDKAGSGAGFFITALHMAGRLSRQPMESSEEVTNAERALAYLQKNRERISKDMRCLELLLDLWWIVHTGSRFFATERATVPLSQDQWGELLAIVQDIEATGESQRPVMLAYIRAIGLFHIGYVQQCLDAFREVERESDQIRGSRRIVKSYLASTAAGTPMTFHGTVSRLSPDGKRGDVYVEELRRTVPFFPADFGKFGIGRGETLGEFHIAFNYLGPVADPPFHYRG